MAPTSPRKLPNARGSRRAEKLTQLYDKLDLAGLAKLKGIRDKATGFGAMLADGAMDSILRPILLPTIGKSVEESLFQDKQRGTFAPLSPNPGLPILVNHKGMFMACLLAPRDVGIEVGEVVWSSRSPAITPYSNLPALVVGHTDDGTIGCHPTICKWVYRGDYDGDQVRMVKFPVILLSFAAPTGR